MSSRHCTVTVDLDPEQAAFVDRLVKAGTHPDAAAVVRAALAEYGAAGEDEAAGPHRDLIPQAVLDESVSRGLADIARGDCIEMSSEADLDACLEDIWTEACHRAATASSTGQSRRRA